MTARIRVRLTPRGGRDAIDGWDGDVLRARVSPPAVDGRANEALIRLLSGALGVPRSNISIISGERSRTKLVEVEGLAQEDLRIRLGGIAGKSR